MSLPAPIAEWFARRGWKPHAHQLATIAADQPGASALLIAPTGGGKTLAGFLASLAALIAQPAAKLHTLYVSPLKALTVDVHRNLEIPIAEMGLAIRAETRTGDTPAAKRRRQWLQPPEILLTTPESLALLISLPEARHYFSALGRIVIDELHALADSKRGDLLALGLARLERLAPQASRLGLSATVAEPDRLRQWLAPSSRAEDCRLILGAGGAAPEIGILESESPLPWAGHMALYALADIYNAIRSTRTAIVFVNTRAQAEIVFQALWRANEDNLAIALHHGSLAPEQRRKVEAAMAAGKLRAVVATSSLDLGIDWGGVDLVIQVGAPKGATRLLQRVGRANHRIDEPSRALLVAANPFEMLECHAAKDAVAEGDLDGAPPKPGGLDVLAQHITGMAASAPFAADDLYDEIVRATPYRTLPRRDFDDCLGFVATGGYALGSYERFRRLALGPDGLYRIADPSHARRYRMNIGTIVETPMLKVRLGRRVLGEVEEEFVSGLVEGDTFVFAGHGLRFEGLRDNEVVATKAAASEPKVPVYGGGRLPLTTQLAERVRAILAEDSRWAKLTPQVQEWLRLQRWASVLPPRRGLLAEGFPRGGKEFLVLYPFEGRNAHQTLGLLLTKRMERAGLGPLGFVATDYVLAVWSLRAARDLPALLAEDMLGEDLESWMAESSLLRRTFRNCAVIAGLIERNQPGERKTRRQVTISSNLIYDVLRRYEPDHILLRATRADAATGLTDVRRLAEMLARIKTRIRYRRLDRVSPLALPALLHIGHESVAGTALEELLDERAEALIEEALSPRETAQPVLL